MLRGWGEETNVWFIGQPREDWAWVVQNPLAADLTESLLELVS